jgi:hypothetical protein
MKSGILLTFLIFDFLFLTCSYADTTTGLVGWWTFNDGAGTSAVDSSGQGNAGVLNSAPAWVPGNRQPYGLSFSGGNYVEIPSSSNYDSTTGSWTGWIKTTQTDSGGYPGIMGRSDPSASLNGIYVNLVETTSKFNVGFKNGSGTLGELTSLAAINDGKWHFFLLLLAEALLSVFILILFHRRV